MKSFAVLLAPALLLITGPLEGGSYSDVAACDTVLGCHAGIPASMPTEVVPPFAITHSLGYDRAGGVIEIPVCVVASSPGLVGPTQRAIATWNSLVPITKNCVGCTLWEEDEPSSDEMHAESILLHELGHCAMALDHPDRNWDSDTDGFFEPTSYTRSTDAGYPGGISAGLDGVRGSRDDQQLGPGGPFPIAKSVAWFRPADNDPLVIDDTVIESGTFSRSVSDLPPGDLWMANGNRRVGTLLGLAYTQAVMYSRGVGGQQYSGLSADEVNMVHMAMTGEDLLAGTSDDYTIQLVYVPNCASEPSAIRVTFSPPGLAGQVASCQGLDIDYSFPPANPMLARHFSLIKVVSSIPPFIRLNEELAWNTDPPVDVIFIDGFESGKLSSWDDYAPFSSP